jgi:hypothetical protein
MLVFKLAVLLDGTSRRLKLPRFDMIKVERVPSPMVEITISVELSSKERSPING